MLIKIMNKFMKKFIKKIHYKIIDIKNSYELFSVIRIKLNKQFKI
jgi:hypothetical protein